MSAFLLEIGCEEIPAHFMPDILEQVKQKGQFFFEQHRLPYSDMEVYGTPRRIALLVRGVAPKQENLEQIIKGPAKKAAYDDSGNPTKALIGFMRSQGVKAEDLTIDDVNGVPYVFAHKVQEGAAALEVLKDIGPELITALSFPKSMRWGDKEMRFVRPIRWIVALLDNLVVPFEIDGIASDRYSRGHRFLGEDRVPIADAVDYSACLERQYVIADPQRRRDMIRQQMRALVQQVNGHVVEDAELLDEVVYLVEYPTALLGRFDDQYLKLPKEAVITPMKDHQRYFPVVDASGKLMPYFIAVRNGTSDYIDIVRAGNEKVLRARLADAEFFFEDDMKRPLAQRIDELKGIVFHDGLGTLYDKTMRLQRLCGYIGRWLGLSENMLADLDRAAYLSRADLVTEMVNEFDELQGVMGREYALLQGEHPAVAQAIYEMYLPRGAGDDLPQSVMGLAISLADKLDTLCGYFSIGLQPTGSQDPYGLRRQALGICRMIYDKQIKLSLSEAIRHCLDIYGIDGEQRRQIFSDVLAFIKQRVRSMLIDDGLPYDAVDAAIAADFDDLCDVRRRAEVIAQWKQYPDFEDLLTAFNRPNNLAAKAGSLFVDESLLMDHSEKELWQICRQAGRQLDEALGRGDYDTAYGVLKSIKPAVDRFFDAVLVMVDEPAVRANRLALLNNVAGLFKRIGDFSLIVI